MADAYIFDAVRTPRGRGRKDGSLHEITALSLATQVLEALRDRNGLDTRVVDDVVLGCVAPVGEQGSDIARTAVLNADYAESTAGVQINRFCASGLEACNMAAAKVMVGEAERVSEIAHTKVWIDGKSVDIKRLPDGLEVKLPTKRHEIISAYADRGIIDYQGDSFIITLAAYAQSRPVKKIDDLKLGLDDDQLRLLLVASDGGSPVVKAIWKGKPVADAVVKVFRGTAESTEFHTDAKGEIACPDLKRGGVSLLAQVEDKTPGKRDGKAYSKTRYKATLTLIPEGSTATK